MLTEFLQRILILPLRYLFRFFLGYRVMGQENLKNLKRPFIIIANHVTVGDPFLIVAGFPPYSKNLPIRFVAKRELFEQKGIKKIVGIVVSALGGLKVERGVGLEKTLEYPLSILLNKRVVTIFPTGMREKPRGRPRKARRGAAYLALKTGVPILPIALINVKGITFKDVPKIIKLRMRGREVKVVIGKPFYLPKKLKYPKDIDKARDIIDAVLTKTRKLRTKKVNNVELLNEWIQFDLNEWIPQNGKWLD